LYLRGVTFLFFWLAFATANAATSFCFLLSSDSASYQAVVDNARTTLVLPEPPAIRTEVLKTAVSDQCRDADLVVAVGYRASLTLIQNYPDIAFLSVFIPKTSVDNWLAANPSVNLIGAIYIDQPPERLARLAEMIVGSNARVSMLVSEAQSSELDELELALEAESLTLKAGILDVNENPVRQLEEVMADSQLFLVLPDSAEITRNTAKWIIFLSYRFRLPVIGFSEAYAEAGALLSIYSQPAQLGRQLGRLLNRYSQNEGRFSPGFVYPEDFELKVNDSVRRSLNREPIDLDSIHGKLKDAEI